MDTAELKKNVEELQNKFPNKYVKESFDFINKILDIEICSLLIPSIKEDSYKAALIKNAGKGFTVSFEGVNEFPKIAKTENWLETDITLSSENITLSLTRVHVTGTGNEFKLTRVENENYFNGSLRVNMHIEGFTIKQNEKAFYRQIFKIDSFDIYRFLKTEAFNLIDYWHGYGLFKFLINNAPYSLFVAKVEGHNYLIIDCEGVVDFEVFSSNTYSVCVALGFITCNFIQNECWYIEAGDKDFREIKNVSYTELRNSMSGFYNPIHQNPYAYFRGNLPTGFPNKLTVIDQAIFSKLCDEICTNDKLLGALIIFMEAHKLSIYSKGASYSVTLEMLTQMIADKNAGFNPIVNDKISSDMIKEMRFILDKYKTQIEDPGQNKKADFINSVDILGKKLDGLNSPTNKDKLTIPFQLYKINIVPGSDEDKAISHRNSFLHGVDLRKSKNTYLTEHEVWGVTLHLVNLINKLILKYVGYEGYTIDYAEYNLNHENLDPNKLFVKI